MSRAARPRGLGVEQVVLAGARGQLDLDGVAGALLGAAREAQLAAHRRSVVLEVDPDRHPRAGRGRCRPGAVGPSGAAARAPRRRPGRGRVLGGRRQGAQQQRERDEHDR